MHGDNGFGALVRRLAVGLEEGPRCGSRGRNRLVGTQRRSHLIGRDVHALLVLLPAEDHVERHDADAGAGPQVLRQVGRGVGDEGDAHGSQANGLTLVRMVRVTGPCPIRRAR